MTDREVESIKKIVGSERISIGESILDLHAKDESFHQRRKPDVVVWPLSATEISQILKLANEKRIPVTPWGAGMSLEGNPIPVAEGSRGRGRNCPFCAGMRWDGDWRTWRWAWKKEVYEERAWGKSHLDETDQKTFRSQWNHESGEDF